MSSYQFGDFVLDCGTRQLRHQVEPVHLSPKAFHLLQLLIEAAPQALSKAQLQDRLWPDTFVVEANLQHLITEIRGALGDDPRQPRYIRTIHGFGYAFQRMPKKIARHDGGRGVLCRLRWSGGRVTLAAGEHIVGRDPSADMVIDSTAVSRRHARIQISERDVTLEDLGSKNGSFVGDRPVDGVVKLADGDEIRFGTVPVTVRISTGTVSTETAIRHPAAS